MHSEYKITQVEERYVEGVAIVTLVGMFDDELFEVSGVAKKHPTDKANKTVGLTLARGRAFEKLGKKFLKRGAGYVRHYDNLQVQKSKEPASFGVSRVIVLSGDHCGKMGSISMQDRMDRDDGSYYPVKFTNNTSAWIPAARLRFI